MKPTNMIGAPTPSDLDAFKSAVEARDAKGLRALLQQAPALAGQINAPHFSFGATAAIAAHNSREVMDVLIDNGADLNLRSDWWAGSFGVLDDVEPEMGDYLLSRGARLDAHAAAGLGKISEMRAMLDGDSGLVHAKGGDGQRPLHFAATPDVVDLLLELGADIEARCVDHESTAAQWLLSKRPDVCLHLIKRGAMPDIFMACVLGDADMARHVADRDPSCINARIGSGEFAVSSASAGHIYLYTPGLGATARPLHVAGELGHQAVLDVLLPLATQMQKLLLAFCQADSSAVAVVLRASPGIMESMTADDLRVLPDAAWENNLPGVRLMLQSGFPVDARGADNGTALDRAAIRGYSEIAAELISNGASLTVVNAYGGTPLGACKWGAENFRDPNGDYAATARALGSVIQ